MLVKANGLGDLNSLMQWVQLSNATRTTDINGAQITQNIAPQVDAGTAQQVANAVGGVAVQYLQPNATFSQSTGFQGVRMPDGRTVDATAIANIINNDAMWPTAAMKQAEIDRLPDVNFVPMASNPGAQAIAESFSYVNPSVNVSPSSTPKPTVYNPVLNFANLSTNNRNLFTGGIDKWSVSINGAKPGGIVSVTATVNGGAASTSNVGTTDASGNFLMTGVMSQQYGTWVEIWSVDGVQVGTISFTVAQSSSNATISPYTGGNSNTTNSTQTTVTNGQQIVDSGYVPSTVIEDAWTGFNSLFKPSEWSGVFSSGNAGMILGLLAIPAVAGYMVFKKGS